MSTSPVYINLEFTPNPNTLKYSVNRTLIEKGARNFVRPQDAAQESPLAAKLFDVPGISGVMIGRDFVTVTKTDAIGWQALKPQVLAVLMEHFVAGLPVLEGDMDEMDEDVDPADAEVVEQIKELLDTRVRPAVAGDGGDIIFRGFRDGIVRLRMQGACSGCPSSRATLKHGVENMLRHFVPEVQAVEQVDY